MISGAHVIVRSPKGGRRAELLAVTCSSCARGQGGGWLLFALPPSELAVHPSDGDDRHEHYLMCELH